MSHTMFKQAFTMSIDTKVNLTHQYHFEGDKYKNSLQIKFK